MLSHIWTVICKKSVIDQASNNLSMYEALEKLSFEIKVQKKLHEYVLPFEYEVVSFWSKDAGGPFFGKFRLELHSPSGKRLGKGIENELNVPKDMKRVRTRLSLHDIVVSESGDYFFVMYLISAQGEESIVSKVPLEIEVKVEKN